MSLSLDRVGLCSVTLRASTAEEVVDRAALAGLRRIEWGADVHAPPVDTDRLSAIREISHQRGLAVSSYGSYWRAGTQPISDAVLVIAAAEAIGAPRIRIWAGQVGTKEADEEVWGRTVDATRAAAAIAAERGIELAFEFHAGSLTDTVASTIELLARVDRPNISTYWQPPVDASDLEALAGLRALGDRVSAVHVFSWWPGQQRLPLAARADLWVGALHEIERLAEPIDLLLEFVPDDDPDLLPREAQTLTTWITEALS